MPGPRVAVLVLSVVVSPALCSSSFAYAAVLPSPSDPAVRAGSSTTASAGPYAVNERAYAFRNGFLGGINACELTL